MMVKFVKKYAANLVSLLLILVIVCDIDFKRISAFDVFLLVLSILTAFLNIANMIMQGRKG